MSTPLWKSALSARLSAQQEAPMHPDTLEYVQEGMLEAKTVDVKKRSDILGYVSFWGVLPAITGRGGHNAKAYKQAKLDAASGKIECPLACGDDHTQFDREKVSDMLHKLDAETPQEQQNPPDWTAQTPTASVVQNADALRGAIPQALRGTIPQTAVRQEIVHRRHGRETEYVTDDRDKFADYGVMETDNGHTYLGMEVFGFGRPVCGKSIPPQIVDRILEDPSRFIKTCKQVRKIQELEKEGKGNRRINTGKYRSQLMK